MLVFFVSLYCCYRRACFVFCRVYDGVCVPGISLLIWFSLLFLSVSSRCRCLLVTFCSGTTSLARWLDAHPATHWVANPRRPHQIEQTGVKEAHVFDDPPKGPLLTEQVY